MNPTVLIVDDMIFVRESLKRILDANGYKVIAQAENGEEAIALYKKLKPDLVTMDITMPDLDGLAALKKIKGIDSDAKVVMISAMGQQKNVLEAVRLGAKNFIVKPFNEESVLEVLNPLFKK